MSTPVHVRSSIQGVYVSWDGNTAPFRDITMTVLVFLLVIWVTTYVIAWMLQTRSMTPSLIYTHCLVTTDTYLYNFTKGKTYLVNQRWRHTKCLQHPCYDVGCYPCSQVFLNFSLGMTVRVRK